MKPLNIGTLWNVHYDPNTLRKCEGITWDTASTALLACSLSKWFQLRMQWDSRNRMWIPMNSGFDTLDKYKDTVGLV